MLQCYTIIPDKNEGWCPLYLIAPVPCQVVFCWSTCGSKEFLFSLNFINYTIVFFFLLNGFTLKSFLGAHYSLLFSLELRLCGESCTLTYTGLLTNIAVTWTESCLITHLLISIKVRRSYTHYNHSIHQITGTCLRNYFYYIPYCVI